jgi:hypothetical protein
MGQSETGSEFVCEQCRGGIDEEASRCPHCGYTAGTSHHRWAIIHGILGFITFMTVIGIPLGLWMWYKGRKHKQKAKAATPAVSA